jgi:hypothetical protein
VRQLIPRSFAIGLGVVGSKSEKQDKERKSRRKLSNKYFGNNEVPGHRQQRAIKSVVCNDIAIVPILCLNSHSTDNNFDDQFDGKICFDLERRNIILGSSTLGH